MIPFKTIVMFDLETTGLPHLEHGRTKITEMSLVACIVTHLQGEEIPRVINKLTLALNPMKIILPTTSQITGLENELLEEMKTFNDNVVLLLNGFLERLPQPVCLIAHNGVKFDFPILMKHINKCKTKLIDNIYCADSLPAFRKILQNLVYSERKGSYKSVNHSPVSVSTNSVQFSDIESTTTQILNETTPSRKPKQFNASPVKHPVHFVRGEHFSVSRKLHFDSDDKDTKHCIKYDNNSSNSSLNEIDNQDILTIYDSQINQRNLRSHKLSDIYSYLHGGETKIFHRSEDDCMALLSCINKCKDDFINWLQYNAVLLSHVKPLF